MIDGLGIWLTIMAFITCATGVHMFWTFQAKRSLNRSDPNKGTDSGVFFFYAVFCLIASATFFLQVIGGL